MRLLIALLLICSSATAAESASQLQLRIDAASKLGGVVQLQAQEYELSHLLTLKANVTIDGNGATLRMTDKKGGPLVVAPNASNVTLRNLTVIASGCDYALQCSAMRDVDIDRCTFKGDVAKGALVDFNGACENVQVTNCTFANAMHLLRLRGANVNVEIDRCNFTDWLHYAVYLVPAESMLPILFPEVGPHDITISNNNLSKPKAGIGGARQMIVAYPTNARIVAMGNLRILNNDCIGTEQDYDRTSPTSTGSADMISLHYVDGVLLQGNRTLYGGENGMVVTNACRNVQIVSNESAYNVGHGIQFGSVVDAPSYNALIANNDCRDNGTRLGGQGDVMSGIYVHGAHAVTLNGNRVADTRPVRKLKVGLLIASSKNVDLGRNSVFFVDKVGKQDVAIYESQMSPAVLDIYSPNEKR